MNMFCYQCEQTAKGTGCTAYGACGKAPDTAVLQDLLTYAIKDISRFAHRARAMKRTSREIDRFVCDGLFATVTNVNFDPVRVQDEIKRGAELRRQAVKMYEDAARATGQTAEKLSTPVQWWKGVDDLDEMIRKGESVSIQERLSDLGEDITGLQELLTYGLKGIGAYAYHARVLGKEDDDLYAGIEDMLDYLTRRPVGVAELLQRNMDVGALNLKVMALLDAANTGAYGNPEPTNVRVTPVAGKCIAVSGHDLKDLEEVLKQTAGKGINVYTHSEMFPCNAYPGLKKYKHLVGNYGKAWQDQRQDFETFPGAIVMTTNCLQMPKESYKARIFTCGPTAWPGVQHIKGNDFTPAIEAALAAPGFAADAPEKYIMTGFAHEAVMSVAGKVIDAVKAGKIRHFFLIGGCDGAKPGRNYYTELAEQIPNDCVILTLACGKYRFHHLPLGSIDGIPRMLDCGQCNDAYSAIQVAVALAKAFGCGVNDLPLSLVLSWFEQKAVSILLTLLHLGIKNIRIGPSLPAFISPAALAVLAEKFNLMPITTPQQDLEAMLGQA